MREPMALASVRSLLARPPLFWTRRFAAISLLCVVATALTSATLLSKYVAERMIRHNAELARDFVGSLMRMHRGDQFFVDRQDTRGIESLFVELARMPGLGHANVFDTGRRLVWSTNAQAIGQDAGTNRELDGALAGELEVESELLETTSFIKPEHAFLRNDARDAVEVYIPVEDGGGRVVGVIELYMLPEDLLNDVHEMTRFVWIACVLSGLVTYLALVWLVMMADRQIAQQQRTIVANESLVAVGDMASAVAHGLRNPLGAIRSSAELIAMGPEREMAGDIMSEVDRLQGWIAKLLAYAQQGGRALGPVRIDEVLNHLVETHTTRMERQGVTVRCDWPAQLPQVQADAPALEQALDNLVSNALDAMPQGGTLSLSVQPLDRRLRLTVADTGVGISPEDLERVFTPYHTTKRTGIGVGLPLARRSAERLGGSLRLESRLGAGTQAILELPLTPPHDPTPSARRT
ncbi:sensor histidine kinase [Hydrogenophaga flava]|uniref:sensor histidine kinase n=1 Tax=Hydrogenophaga flava TaxID=65657 RepID=UPI0012F90EAB|nr:ATP-binding protein [Hydrogenophaga flava]